jgi:protein SCO1
MDSRTHSFARRLGSVLFAGLLLGACSSAPDATPTPALPATNFTLTDHNGQPFELASLRGKVVMVFFGYSTCPDVCPTTLSKLSMVTKRLGDARTRVKTLYVTVDPARDTPEVLKADLGLFSLDALGLTGTREQIDRVVAQYGAKYEIVPTPQSAGKYSVSHSTELYLLDATGTLRKTFAYEATAEEIVTGLRAVLGDSTSVR